MAESFFASLECELLDRCIFKTQNQARLAIFEFIEGWYNPWRRHSSLGYLSPVEFERQFAGRGDNAAIPAQTRVPLPGPALKDKPSVAASGHP